MTCLGMQMKFQSVNSIIEVRLTARGRRKTIRIVLFHSELTVKFQHFFGDRNLLGEHRRCTGHISFPHGKFSAKTPTALLTGPWFPETTF